MARRNPLKDVSEPESRKFFRNWRTAKQESKEANDEVGLVVKAAIQSLDVSKKSFNFIAALTAMDPLKAQAIWREIKRLAAEAEIDAQMDLVDELDNQQPAA